MKTLGAALLVMFAFAVGSGAQTGPLQIGTVTPDDIPASCPPSLGWLSGTGVTCRHASVSCQQGNGVVALGITFAYEKPPSALGTIVFFSDGDGTSPKGNADPDVTSHNILQYAEDYFADNYEVVQTAWDSEWEDPSGNDHGGNIGYAACRPATFLSWVNTNLYGPIHQALSTAGMCVQGLSAGGGAGTFALAWYGAGTGTTSYIDKLSLTSSPPLSDIEQGCMIPNNHPDVTVCPQGPPVQLGCNPKNTPLDWTQSITYTDAAFSVGEWTGRAACATSTTTGQDNTAWKAMSIVDGSIGTFNYPSTNITAWLCSSVNTITCTKDCAMNNSSPEAQLFFSQFTSTSQYQGLTINGVGNCGNAEEAGAGDPPSNYIGLQYNPNNPMQTVQSGWQAVEYDMIVDSQNKCVSHHGQ